MKRLAPLLLAAALCLSGCGASAPVAPAADPTPIAAPTVPPTNMPAGDLEGCIDWIDKMLRDDYSPTWVHVEYFQDANSIIIVYEENRWTDKIAERDANWWASIPEACQQLMEYIIVHAVTDYSVTGVDFLFILYCGEETPLMILNTDIVKDYMKTEE